MATHDRRAGGEMMAVVRAGSRSIVQSRRVLGGLVAALALAVLVVFARLPAGGLAFLTPLALPDRSMSVRNRSAFVAIGSVLSIRL